ncbi:MAG: hypothetical protein FPO08_00405 [Geobacter sp.]|nr:MAG: hypothetical protein FPO08_00405 [Geobacter sp.]
MRKWILLVMPVLLSACSTTPVQLKDAQLVPSDRIFAFQTKDEGKGAITVIRDKGIVGSACYAGLYLNDTLAARVGVAEAATFYVEPGEVLLRLGWDPQGRGLCGMSASDWVQRETVLKRGEGKQFRLTLTHDAEWDIIRGEASPETAAKSVSAPFGPIGAAKPR